MSVEAPAVGAERVPVRTARVRRAAPADRGTVLELLGEHLPGVDVARRHAWLYEGNPHGRSVTMIASDPTTGEPMGLTSLFPRRVLVAGKERLGSIGGDGYVRARFRRRGVATALHRACVDAMAAGERGGPVGFMFGGPLTNNLKALLRAGSRLVGNLQRFSRPAIAQRAALALAGDRSATHLEEITWEHVPALDALWQAAKDDRLVMPVRDAVHWLWRFSDTPAGVQRGFIMIEGAKPIGAVAIELREDCAAIVDLLAPRGHLTRALWAAALACGRRTVTMQVNQGSPLVAPLLACGFFPREKKGYQVLASGDDGDATSLFDRRRWYYTWGDCDGDRVFDRPAPDVQIKTCS
jgi:hypothetical protein